MAEVVAEAALDDVVEAGPEQAHDDRPGDQPVDRRPVDPVAAEVGHDRDPVAHVEGHGVHDAVPVDGGRADVEDRVDADADDRERGAHGAMMHRRDRLLAGAPPRGACGVLVTVLSRRGHGRTMAP